MIAFICLFLPPVLCVWLFEHLRKKSLSRKQWLYRYCAANLCINGVCFVVKRFVLDTGHAVFASFISDVTPAAAVNYLIMAIPTALMCAYLQILLVKHTSITVEEEKDA